MSIARSSEPDVTIQLDEPEVVAFGASYTVQTRFLVHYVESYLRADQCRDVGDIREQIRRFECYRYQHIDART
jgi:hypothetical protein